jgi:drug/metabolite transporter (DMT)-like permease
MAAPRAGLMIRTSNKPLFAGYLLAIGATIFWSGNFIVARELNQTVPPVSLAFWRWLVAVVVLFPFAFKALVSDWPHIRSNFPYLSVTAFLGITIFNTMLYIGGQTSSALNLSLISITSPIFIVILARLFLGEKLTLYKGVGIVIVALGVILLITRGKLVNLLSLSFAVGDLWMLSASFGFAVYSILVLRKPKQIGIWAFQLSTFVLGFIFLLPFYAWELHQATPVVFDGVAIFSILYLGVFASVFSFVLWNKSILVIGAAKTGMVYYTLPLFSGILAYFFLGEGIGLLHLVTGLMIVSGILIANYEQPRNR